MAPPNVSAESQANFEVLKAAITEPAPFCNGVLALQDEAFRLMYKKRDAERKSGFVLMFCDRFSYLTNDAGLTSFLNFVNATEAGLHQLAVACDPATTRIGDRDVLDLLYWTAGKMDEKDFMTGIDLERAGLMDAVRYDLLDGKKSTQPIYAELDNLNFYGMSLISLLISGDPTTCGLQIRDRSSNRTRTSLEAKICSARSSSSSPPCTRAAHSSSVMEETKPHSTRARY